jgi:aliphatic nitrilase
VGQITPDETLQRVLSGGCYTAIIGPEGNHLGSPITDGEGMAIADLDFSLITKRKRMMDSVGHYARPDLLQLKINTEAQSVVIASQPDHTPQFAATPLNLDLLTPESELVIPNP